MSSLSSPECPAVSTEPSQLTLIVQSTLELYDGLFDGLVISRRLALDLPAVLVDPELVRRVLINIIDNAIEANDGRGEILVTTRDNPEHGAVRVEIADHGPGVDPEDEEKLFAPYYSTKRRGSGLGLAIVKRIVAEHRGRVFVEKNEPHRCAIRDRVSRRPGLPSCRRLRPETRSRRSPYEPGAFLGAFSSWTTKPGYARPLAGILEDEGYVVETCFFRGRPPSAGSTPSVSTCCC